MGCHKRKMYCKSILPSTCPWSRGNSVLIGISRNVHDVCTWRHTVHMYAAGALARKRRPAVTPCFHDDVSIWVKVTRNNGPHSPVGVRNLTMTSGRPQQANRLTRIFLQMKETCPEHLQTYAACVLAQHKEGSLDHKSCETEFSRVKSCFRSVRRAGR